MKSLRRLASVVSCLLIVVAVAACGGGVSQGSYDKINNGMTAAEVESILGKPTDSGGGGIGGMSAGSKTWKSGDKSITVTFMNEKVSLKGKAGF